MTWNEEAEKWIELARSGHDPNEADTRRVRRALIARSVVAGSVATTAGAAASATTVKALVVNAGAALIVAGSVTTATTLFLDTQSRVSPESPVATSATSRSPARTSGNVHRDGGLVSDSAPATVTAREPEPLRLPSLERGGQQSLRSASVRPGPAAPRSAASAGAATPALEREIAGLRSAQQALHRGQVTSAARALDRLEATNPDGALLEERLATRTILACSAGEPSALQRFLERYPTSVHSERVREACERKPAVGRFPETDPTAQDH